MPPAKGSSRFEKVFELLMISGLLGGGGFFLAKFVGLFVGHWASAVPPVTLEPLEHRSPLAHFSNDPRRAPSIRKFGADVIIQNQNIFAPRQSVSEALPLILPFVLPEDTNGRRNANRRLTCAVTTEVGTRIHQIPIRPRTFTPHMPHHSFPMLNPRFIRGQLRGFRIQEAALSPFLRKIGLRGAQTFLQLNGHDVPFGFGPALMNIGLQMPVWSMKWQSKSGSMLHARCTSRPLNSGDTDSFETYLLKSDLKSQLGAEVTKGWGCSRSTFVKLNERFVGVKFIAPGNCQLWNRLGLRAGDTLEAIGGRAFTAGRLLKAISHGISVGALTLTIRQKTGKRTLFVVFPR